MTHETKTHEKKPDALLEKLTLAEVRKRIEEFRHVKPIAGKSGSAPAPTRPKRSAPRRKR